MTVQNGLTRLQYNEIAHNRLVRSQRSFITVLSVHIDGSNGPVCSRSFPQALFLGRLR